MIPALKNAHSFFSFTFRSNWLGEMHSVDVSPLCLFFSENFFDPENLARKIFDFSIDLPYHVDIINGVINYLIVLLPKTDQIESFINSEYLKNHTEFHRLSHLTRISNPVFIMYDVNGNWFLPKDIFFEKDIAELVEEIKLAGSYEIFDSGYGILQSSDGHHYVLQNEYHSDKFIRTANILTSSLKTDFLSVFLLGFIDNQTTQIYIDTSGIIGIPYAICKLKNIFLENFNPSIFSFNSYSGISNLAFDDKTRFLISASTSGKLAQKLVDLKVPVIYICTLFYLHDKSPIGKILCNLLSFKKYNSEKYSRFIIEKETECTFCTDFSYPIKIVGEQFLPEALKVDTFTFDLTDRPVWLTKFVKDYFNGGIVKSYLKASTELKRDIYIDFKKVFKIIRDRSGKKFVRNFSSKLPNNIDYIISYDDEGSDALATWIIEDYYTEQKSIIHIKDKQIKENREKLDNKSILVVSSTITNGRRLIETSLKLRECNSKGICYFIGISRSPDESTLETVSRYLGFDNSFGKNINPVIIVDSIFISDLNTNVSFSQSIESSWESEKKLLKLLPENSLGIDRLKSLDDEQGLEDNLFWADSNGKSLKLRSNFAFYYGITPPSMTKQSEVFFLINSILHNLRKSKKRKLHQTAFHRHVISPETFICYNDGVIQGSILRSANPIELNYSLQGDNTRVGKEMINVLKSIFKNFDNEAGEGTVEFLIALCTKRLQVLKKDLKPVVELLKSQVELTSIHNKGLILLLCEHLIKNITDEPK